MKMRRSSRFSALFYVRAVASFLFFLPVSVAGGTECQTITVNPGWNDVTLYVQPADSRLNGDPGCVGDQFAEWLTGGPSLSMADQIWKWDPLTQSYQYAFLIDGWGGGYDGRWWDWDAGDFSTMTLDACEPFQIKNFEGYVKTVEICGEPTPCPWYVDGSVPESGDGASWETAFKTIREGIDAAADSDEVIVGEGTYVENINFNGKNITLRSTDPETPDVVRRTIIDGGWAGPVVTFSGVEVEACVLSGFNIKNGWSWTGGGICGNGTLATIRKNIIIGNEADMAGGLFGCNGNIEENTISGNSALLYDGGALYDCNGTIQYNRIISNSANGGGGGGLAWCMGLMQNNVIAENSAAWGGGLWECNGTIRNNLVAGNSAEEGGGLYGFGGDLQNNTIVDNSARWFGGGIAYFQSNIQNCIIWGNTAMEGAQLYLTSMPWYSCIQDWPGGGENNTAEYPEFADPDGGDNDPGTYHDNNYRLSYFSSPCIDKGRNEDWMWTAVDLDGNPRIWDSEEPRSSGGNPGVYPASPSLDADMGPYEFFVPLGNKNLLSVYVIAVPDPNDPPPGITIHISGIGPIHDWMYQQMVAAGHYTISVTAPPGCLLEEDVKYAEVQPIPQPPTSVTFGMICDTTPPEITLSGDNPLTLECGTPYSEPGFTATDDLDGDITDRVVVTGSVDHTTVDTYLLHYNVSDSAGNPAEEKTRTVNVVAARPFNILKIAELSPSTLQVTWSSRQGATYTVWSCFHLGTGPWKAEATVASDGATTTWTDSDTACPCKFYKIELK